MKNDNNDLIGGKWQLNFLSTDILYLTVSASKGMQRFLAGFCRFQPKNYISGELYTQSI